jgi:hypothetical protein
MATSGTKATGVLSKKYTKVGVACILASMLIIKVAPVCFCYYRMLLLYELRSNTSFHCSACMIGIAVARGDRFSEARIERGFPIL